MVRCNITPPTSSAGDAMVRTALRTSAWWAREWGACLACLALTASHLCALFVAAEADLRDQGLPADGAEEGRQMCAAALAQGLSPGCFLKLDSSRCLTVRLWDSELPCQT